MLDLFHRADGSSLLTFDLLAILGKYKLCIFLRQLYQFFLHAFLWNTDINPGASFSG